MIDTRLITFLTLLEEKNYTKTAKKLYITQPAVTHHIKSLEKEHNITLFTDSKDFNLTREGQLLREYAILANQEYNHFQNAISKPSKTVINASITPLISNHVIKSLFNNKMLFDKALLNVNLHQYRKIEKELLNGTSDFAIIDSSFDSQLFDSFHLETLNVILICNPNGIHKNKERITREALLQSIVVFPNVESGLYKIAYQALINKNIRLKNNTILYANSVEWMINHVLEYDGIAFAYEESVMDYLNNGTVKKIELLNYNPTQNVYLLYNKKIFLDKEALQYINMIKGGRE